MNITQVLDKTVKYASQLQFVNTVFKGDIYENLNGHPDIKYGVVNIDIPSVTINENMQVMDIYLYYADRLTQDGKNEYEIKSTSELVLSSIINYLGEIGDVFDGYQVNFFNQQFADNLAGGYVQIQFETRRILDNCLLDEYITEEEDLIERLKEAIREYEAENAQLALLLKEILFRLSGEQE